MSNSWSISDAKELYNIAHWSDGFFDISESGNLLAFPDGNRTHAGIDLMHLCDLMAKANLTFPVLIRFTDILRKRFDLLHHAFERVIQEEAYQGRYTAVYPIKVNQQSRVVSTLIQHGGDRLGLEAGSKPELMAVLALTDRPNAVVVCNGYKDREYIRLALIGQALGKQVYIILEKLSELDIVLSEAKKLNVQPCLGIRVRLATMGTSKWRDTGGEKSKFGFSASQVLYVIERLKASNALDCLQVLHFHLGSQIANIADVQNGMRECARYYAELCKLGAPIHTVDVGGGLGVDYEGTRSRSCCSVNYTVKEYASNIVHTLLEICQENHLPHPNVITESGRAMTAHHAMLVTNVIGCEQAAHRKVPKAVEETEPRVIRDLYASYDNLSKASALEMYHDTCYYMNEARNMFNYGILRLSERARAEQIYAETCMRVSELLSPSIKAHREVLDELHEKLADKYFCNFSVFQSLPDAWAINQVFPILPLTGLEKKPTRRVILQDITCDSDGSIDIYVDGQGLERTLPLREMEEDKPYLLGIFLVGAYQEILGDMHNLFGDTDSVHVDMQPDGSFQLQEPELGDTVDDILRYVHFDTGHLLNSYRKQLLHANLPPQQYNEFLQALTVGLQGYTYLEGDATE
ncbi:MAG: arginine decarboxylase [Gammaproteobacteria bacterium RIFCSPHIGHO2_12_FULL_45_9]|nr:MAG: arginine decarboxylase [Gammaproteobacteria bacterium RIFCSPHIGHO2_12_FULL_45_9]